MEDLNSTSFLSRPRFSIDEVPAAEKAAARVTSSRKGAILLYLWGSFIDLNKECEDERMKIKNEVLIVRLNGLNECIVIELIE